MEDLFLSKPAPARPPRRALLLGLALLLGACGQQSATPGSAVQAESSLSGVDGIGAQTAQLAQTAPDFGPNVRIFDPSMPVADIQAAVDAVYTQQVGNEFGSQRVALLFKPGSYGSAAQPLIVKVGYYTEVAGLGQSPDDVVINGHVDSYNQCGASGCIALTNFWRGVSNLKINVAGQDGCYASANFWAVSQASPMRRVNVTGGNLSFMDYCTAGPQYASGGFMADSQAGTVVSGSQQQFLVRNSALGSWSNGVWNQVFSGVEGAPAQSFPKPPYTTLDTTPASREKPYLYIDAQGRYNVFVPAARTGSRGVTWATGQTPGRSIPLSDFYVAKPGDSLARIQAQLLRGKHLLLTPGVYAFDRTLAVLYPNTVVLGLGVATINAERGSTPMTVADVPGVDIAGVMFDAGAGNSDVLLRVGTRLSALLLGTLGAGNPTTLHDVYFRIGGARAGRATTSLEVNSNNVILDHIWAWRADHGEGVGWTVNTADTGVVVNGDDVTATGLFVEHYQKTEVLWSGERGRTVMFQNEMPYDPPSQDAWRRGALLGYPAYKVADRVKAHEGWGLGSYIYTNVDPSIHASRGFEVSGQPGVKLHDLLTVQLGAGTIDHVVNDTGAPVDGTAVGTPSNVVSYP